jgi:uncharacterized protein YfaT (DUF1175 family)
MNIPKHRIDFFYSQFDQTVEGCWNWKGCIGDVGYGVMSINNQAIRVHRVSWFVHNGEIPEGKYVLHTCDNRKCVRPSHLFLGTHLDNMRDKIVKGHTPQQDWHWNNKIPESEMETLRKMISDGISQKMIAKKYGVSQSHISHIKTGTHRVPKYRPKPV